MYFSEHGHHHSKLYVLESKEVVRLSDRGDVGELVCEFLEVCIHQLLCIRELYPAAYVQRFLRDGGTSTFLYSVLGTLI